MAEGYFLHSLSKDHDSINVSSAGITALVTHPATEHAQAVMKHHGLDISRHRGRQLTDSLVRQSNLILVMTNNHLNTVTQQYLTAKGKTFLLGHWGNFEIQDPYSQTYETFEKTFELIKLAWQDWKTRILACQNGV
jgi:protein-tyrosine phosphatase